MLLEIIIPSSCNKRISSFRFVDSQITPLCESILPKSTDSGKNSRTLALAWDGLLTRSYVIFFL